MKAVDDTNALKHKFDKAHLIRTADALQACHPAFDRKKYLAVFTRLEPLAMKARVRVLRDELRALLPQDYPQALTIVLQVAASGRLAGFDVWPMAEFIQTYGTDDPSASLTALRQITTIFTSEWAIRPFIKKHPEETLRFLLACARDPETAVRRWASEGTRPRLPWGERLHDFIKDPRPAIPILEALRFDDELFVRKSVANHLNDIAKDHPDLAIRLLRTWKKEAGAQHHRKIDWIIRRSMRTLIKEGHPEALSLLGISSDADVEVSRLKLAEKTIRLGGTLSWSFIITALGTRDQRLIVDYRIHFVRANGRSAIKVFKLKNVTISPGQTLEIAKRHLLKAITTREYYDGIHTLDIQVNGKVRTSGKFVLSGARSPSLRGEPA
jgi:3-methyladenine DNA glycosylase AlkC